MKKIFLIIILCFVSASCSKWKISDLKTKKIIQIDSLKNNGYVDLFFEENRVLILTFKIHITKTNIYIADNRQNILLVFSNTGILEMVIGKKEILDANPLFANIMKSYFNFGVIDEITTDSQKNLFIQNRINSGNSNNLEISPSFVIVFDKDGTLQYTLGQNGNADIPFYYIDEMYTDSQDRLIVISKNFSTWSVYRYRNKVHDQFVNFKENMFIDKSDDGQLNGNIENINIFHNSEKLLLSVAYYQNTRFKYRKIIEYRFGENAEYKGKEILNLPDPKNELFALLEDQYIMLWDVDENELKFSIWNFQDSIVNNKRIPVGDGVTYFMDILLDEEGTIHTVSVKKDFIQIEAWE
ncbi:MAG: hypothetical protein JW982_12920 [Spirochaetes bacterium]|nr:hypothetical protein [Spirochaetota bacterium]